MSRGGELGLKGVLLVDDEADILESLKSVLEATFEDVEVRTAASGPAALELLEREGSGVRLIVSDLSMPGMDGAEFLARARALSPGSHRVLLSAFPESTIRARVAERGPVERIMPKPMDVEEFLGMARELLAR